MCMQDLAIARMSAASEVRVSIAAATFSTLIDRDDDRLSLIISPPLANSLLLSFDESLTNEAVGIRVPAGASPFCLSLAIHGDIVRRKIRASMVVAGETITVWACSHNVPLQSIIAEQRKINMMNF